MMAKICVFGAGAVGNVLAARLARAGQAVSIVARRRHVQAVRAHGLKLLEPDGASVASVAAAEDVDGVERPDLVIVTLKAHALPGAAASIGRLAADAPIVVVVNGIPWWYFHTLSEAPQRQLPLLDPDGELWRHIDPAQVIGGVVRLPAELLEPGVARANGRNDSLLLGDPAGGTTPRLTRIAQQLSGAAPTVEAVADIRLAIWEKLLSNLPSSLLSTLTLSTTRDLVRNPATADLYRRIVEEGQRIAAAHGVPAAVDVPAQMAGAAASAHPPSMLQDLLAGKPLEIDAQLGAVRELARRKQVEIPLIDTMATLLEQRAAPR